MTEPTSQWQEEYANALNVIPRNDTIAAKVPQVLSKLNQDKLNEHIAMEEWERRLLPLFLFRGTKPYRIRALWNIAYGMYLTECDSLSVGAAAIGSGDTGHLCGTHRVPSNMRSIFDRLRMSPELTDSISKAFTEYVEWVHPRYFHLERVPLVQKRRDYREGVSAWWRVQADKKIRARAAHEKKVRVWKLPEAKSADLAYPYVKHAETPEHKLLFDVHRMLPKGLPHEIRGDLCQDLIVAVLSGETTIENIPEVVAKYARDARKILPDRWRNVSLDDILPGTENLTRLDAMAGEVNDEHVCTDTCEHSHEDGEFAFLEALDR